MTIKIKNDMKIDGKDKDILRELQEDGRQTYRDLSKKLRLPESTIRKRVNRLERSGIIKGYHATIDPDIVGQSAVAFALIKVKQGPRGKNKKGAIPSAMKGLTKYDEVQEVYSLAGDYDIMIKIRGKNEKELGDWLMGEFWKIPTIDRSSSLITFRCEKNTQKIKLE